MFNKEREQNRGNTNITKKYLAKKISLLQPCNALMKGLVIIQMRRFLGGIQCGIT